MKLTNVLGLVLFFTLTACGGGGDTLNQNEIGSYVSTPELNQTDVVQAAGENNRNETVLNEECSRLKALSESGTLTRINVLNLEANGTVRSTYFNEYGLFDPLDEPLAVDNAFYVLGRIVVDQGNKRFENTQPAFGKTSVSNPDENQVITANSSIQRTKVKFLASSETESFPTVNFTTDTVGSFGVEDRATFDYSRVDEVILKDMITTVQRYCLKK